MPPSASSNRPSRRSAAPVKAPFSWPNSSDSSSVSGSAAQLTAMKALPRRGERSWSARATSSLPVPDSPWISTVLETGAICSILTSTSCIGRALPADAGVLLEAAALDEPARRGHRLVGPDRLQHAPRSRRAAAPVAALGVGRLEQDQGEHLVLARQPEQLQGAGLVHRAGEDEEVGLLAPKRGRSVVDRRDQRRGEAGGLERRVERDGGLEVRHGEEHLRRHRLRLLGAR